MIETRRRPTVRAFFRNALWYGAIFLAGELVGMGIAWRIGR